MKNVLVRMAMLAVALGAAPLPASGQDLDTIVEDSVNRVMGVARPPIYNPCPAEDTCCLGGDCGCCTSCCRQWDVFGKFEALLWWGKGTEMPALVTTSNPANVPRNTAGVLGFNTTEVLFGDGQMGIEMQGGARGTFGIWLDEPHNVGALVRVYGVSSNADSFEGASLGDPVLARPFFNMVPGQEDAVLIAYDDPMTGDVVDGDVAARYTSSYFATEALGRIMLERDRKKRIDLLAGYQFFRFDDRLRVSSFHTAREGLLNGTTFAIDDRFDCQNEFHGGVLGLQGSMANGRMSLEWMGKVAYGVANQRTTIAGQTVVTPPGAIGNGGVLAMPSNSGTFNRSHNVVTPEVGVTLNYHHTPHLAFGVGYTFIWFNSMLTVGEQIDRRVDRTQLVGPPVVGPFPTYVPREQDYWLMGLNLSVSYDF